VKVLSAFIDSHRFFYGHGCLGNILFERTRPLWLCQIDVFTYCSYNMSVKFEWDETKRLTNIRKHGIDFADVPAIFRGDTVTVIDDRFEYDATRFLTLGLLKSRVILVVHTESDDMIRIISARKATAYEEKTYFEQTTD
jgi:uncharacterized protein